MGTKSVNLEIPGIKNQKKIYGKNVNESCSLNNSDQSEPDSPGLSVSNKRKKLSRYSRKKPRKSVFGQKISNFGLFNKK